MIYGKRVSVPCVSKYLSTQRDQMLNLAKIIKGFLKVKLFLKQCSEIIPLVDNSKRSRAVNICETLTCRPPLHRRGETECEIHLVAPISNCKVFIHEKSLGMHTAQYQMFRYLYTSLLLYEHRRGISNCHSVS